MFFFCVNEPRAVKFVAQRSNRCITTSTRGGGGSRRLHRCLLLEIPLRSEGQRCLCSFSFSFFFSFFFFNPPFPECNLAAVFAGLVSGCQLAG